MKRTLFAVLAVAGLSTFALAQVSPERLTGAQNEPQNWLTYNGTYKSNHYSSLDQIKPGNVANLDMKWVYQVNALDKFETTPLVVDGVMYFTEPPNNIVAVDARNYQITDVQKNIASFKGATAASGNAVCFGVYWVHPTLLRL